MLGSMGRMHRLTNRCAMDGSGYFCLASSVLMNMLRTQLFSVSHTGVAAANRNGLSSGDGNHFGQ